MNRNGKHVRLGQGTGAGCARETKLDRLAAHAEAQSIKTRVFLRLHAPATGTVTER
jgi:hypothetical protein